MRGVAAAVAFVAAIVLLVVAFTANGVPSAPSGTVSATPNPQTAQTLTVTLTTQFYSTAPSYDTVYFIFSASQTPAPVGSTAPYSLSQNTKVVAAVSGSAGSLHTATASFTVTTTAVCSAGGCIGTVLNVTVVSTAYVSSAVSGVLASPSSTVQFSNTAVYDLSPTATADSASFDFMFYGVLTAGVAAILTGVIFLGGTHPVLIAADAVVVAVFIGEIVVWLVVR